ncbi:hypothetical protein BJY52DRAFT_1214870 [Lactarius psammicola]|nr:hypothetical protein BJY52DRAFT_1214870 [Lactarius psammicola]
MVTGVPAFQANDLLGASYLLYRHARANDTAILRTVIYAHPTVLHRHAQTVTLATFFASARTLRTPCTGVAEAPAKAAPREPVTVLFSRDHPKAVSPEDVRRLYKMYTYEPAAVRNAPGIAGFKNEFPSLTFLMSFLTGYRPDANDATFTVEPVNGGWFDPKQAGCEVNFSMLCAQAIAYPTRHVFYSTGGQPTWSESDGEPVPGDSQSPFRMGQCPLLSRGDNGVGVGDYKDDYGRVRFIPKFPASCPYITSVGGTMTLSEVAAGLSGGGFSNYFPRHDYQDNAVPTFLRSLGNKYDALAVAESPTSQRKRSIS